MLASSLMFELFSSICLELQNLHFHYCSLNFVIVNALV